MAQHVDLVIQTPFDFSWVATAEQNKRQANTLIAA